MTKPDRPSALFLARCPDLASLTDRQRTGLSAFLDVHEALAGDVIFGRGQAPEGLYIVLEGEVELVSYGTGRAPTRFVLGPLGVFGESAFGGQHITAARAHRSCRLALFEAARLGELTVAEDSDQNPYWDAEDLRNFVAERALIAEASPWLVEQLARDSLFSELTHSCRADLSSLIEGARHIWIPEGEWLDQGAAGVGAGVVLRGELQATWTPSDGGGSRVVRTLRRGHVFGDLAMVTGQPLECGLTAARRTEAIILSPDRYRQLLKTDRFRRAVRSIQARQTAIRLATDAVEAGRAELVLMESGLRDRRDVDLSGLTWLLATSVAFNFPEDTPTVLVLEPGGEVGTAPRFSTGPDGLRLAQLSLPNAPSAAAIAVGQAAAQLAGDCQYCFLDASALPAELRVAIAPLVTRLVRLIDGLVSPESSLPIKPQCGVCYTVLIDARGPRQAILEPYPSTAVRLRLRDLNVSRPRTGQGAAGLAALDRWARALTQRSVGVALGGGGAWGYSHIALLRGLHAAGVPIDMVSGSSFGSVVAAWYCALGLDSLAELESQRRGWEIAVAAALSAVSSAAVETWMSWALRMHGHLQLRLEDLEIPFIPVATDVLTSSQSSLRRGTVAFGVRASGALPPFFSAVQSGAARYVDGGITANVPTESLRLEGASLVIGSNIVPLPRDTTPSAVLPGPLGRFQDTWRSILILMHGAGAEQAEDADVLYQTRSGRHLMVSFGAGQDIVRETERDPEFERAMGQAKERWDRLRTR